MTPKIFRGKLKNGKIIPEDRLPTSPEELEVQIFVFGPTTPLIDRQRFFGSMKGQWGDPIKYQRKMRKEWERH